MYTCPMHPEVTGNEGDKCPKCGMTLIPSDKDKGNKPEVKISTGSQYIEAGTPINLSISITEQDKNLTLDVVHEKKIHLLIVNEELSWFDHIHPEEQPDGEYHISETFPAAGKYLLFIDYKSSGGFQDVHMHRIEVQGIIPERTKMRQTKLVSTVNEYTVSLLNGAELTTKNVQYLQFSVVKNGRELEEKDMQLYLGATAHIVMISEADYKFLHIHPVFDRNFPIYAETIIKKDGIYRMWVQFKMEDKVHTADFTVNVLKVEQPVENHSEAHHH